MPKKLTNDEFIERMKNINPNIEFLEEYQYINIKMECRCLIDNFIWKATPNSLLKGSGCPKCGRNAMINKQRKTHTEFLHQINKINSNIEILGTYINTHTKIQCKCLIDNYIWSTTPARLLRGAGCPKCANNLKKTHAEFLIDLNKVNPNIKVLTQYINNCTKIKCKCLIDGYEWESIPSNLLSGEGCPKCNVSHGEQKIFSYLNKNNVKYISQYRFDDCRNILPLPFDFYLSDYNVCIEYDGEQHYKPRERFGGNDRFLKQKQNDSIKTQYCQKNNIKLIRIPYWEFENIENILANELGLDL